MRRKLPGAARRARRGDFRWVSRVGTPHTCTCRPRRVGPSSATRRCPTMAPDWPRFRRRRTWPGISPRGRDESSYTAATFREAVVFSAARRRVAVVSGGRRRGAMTGEWGPSPRLIDIGCPAYCVCLSACLEGLVGIMSTTWTFLSACWDTGGGGCLWYPVCDRAVPREPKSRPSTLPLWERHLFLYSCL